MKKHTFLTLTPEQRQQLESLVRTGQQMARKLTRARILLLLDRSQDKRRTDEAIAQVLGCHPKTVANIRHRFLEDGLAATLTDKPMGPTAPRKMTGDLEAKLTVLACSEAPEGHAHWTLRLLAEQCVELGYVDSLSHVTVGETLKNETKPSAQYVSRMEDLLDVYQCPYDPNYPVVCFDETRKELHGSPRSALPAAPGTPARKDYEYERNGSASLLLWYEPLVGTRGVSVRDQHFGIDIAQRLAYLADVVYPQAEKIVLVCDNLGTHKPHFLYELFRSRGSPPPHGAFRVALYPRTRWQFTASDARTKLKRLYPKIKDKTLLD